MPIRRRLRVEGVVQGVGFRPFTHSLAHRLGLGGVVGNDADGVFVEIEGERGTVAEFEVALRRDAPPLAVVEQVRAQDVAPTGERSFAIVASRPGTRAGALVSSDTATCPDCLRELFDPADRRYRYPFVNCTNCGPRFTISTGVPYDRPNTTMAGFAMCVTCSTEYHDPADRRFHAQPVCCPECGPQLQLRDRAGRPLAGDPIAETAALLAEGAVVAVKGLGGYHLAADAVSATAVGTLRSRKHREDKPFAVLVADLDAAAELCELGPAEQQVLSGPAAPVVLLPRRPHAPVAEPVAPHNTSLGLVLPYTPLHHLLASEFAGPLVLTSGNVSDEPIAYTDADAAQRLDSIADAFLTHDRPVHTRTDDSVLRLVHGREYPIRRSRGYVPAPLSLPWKLPRPVLGCGAELKNTFCLARDRHAFVSQHIGDLENYETFRSYTEGITHFSRLFDLEPSVVAHDLHPEYLSTKYAAELDGVDLVGVQHHHAHIASCLTDNGLDGPVIGVAFDGLGYGTDDTVWGGEFLLASRPEFSRLGHLETVAMPGGAAAIRQPWRMAAAYLDAAFPGQPPHLAVLERNEPSWAAVTDLARSGLNSPRTSSAGRLFDAVAAILGLRDAVNYEGQAAVELEQCVERGHRDRYPVEITDGKPFVVLGVGLVRAVVDDLEDGVAVGRIAARFHNTVAAALVQGCEQARDRTGLETVALSGGVFQNLLLLEMAVAALEASGFSVLTHTRVPTNDGGISLGQVAVAAGRDQAAGFHSGLS